MADIKQTREVTKEEFEKKCEGMVETIHNPFGLPAPTLLKLAKAIHENVGEPIVQSYVKEIKAEQQELAGDYEDYLDHEQDTDCEDEEYHPTFTLNPDPLDVKHHDHVEQ